MKRKFAGLTAAAVTSALLLAGCSAGGTDAGGKGDEITMWVIGGDTPDTLRDYLKTTFNEKTGATLKIEEQTWGDIITNLTTKLPDAKNTPDVTEIGNTQSPTFTNAGAFLDISDLYDELGGDDLLQSFVEVGEVDGANYTVPYYFGSRYVFARKDVFAAAGLEQPKTLDEFNSSVEKIAEVNPLGVENFSGFWLGGQDWRNGISWIFANGGNIAEFKDGKWVATLDSPESLKGLEQLQKIYQVASKAPSDAKDESIWTYINDADKRGEEGAEEATSIEAASILAPGWAHWSIGDLDGETRVWNDDKFAAYPLPGNDGKPAPVFAGGSNIGISAKSQNPELAKELMRIIFSEEYQTMLGENGLGPGNQKYVSSLGDDQFATALIESASNSKLTPAAPGWAAIEAKNIMEEFFSQIRDSKDLSALAKDTNAKLDALLNQK
ncbi:extracellular solute-binding protein [Leucobacter sp. UT-8R-CII-1-4]|uniref:extracellular solute-binding protein n=1 Tax=Leucobacter sp. UT-8R-CII-1-4 TaxID=3040075 RepID=UPI0024A7C982|nr:extracellular solute-binding protein [Leucobacter sp. UT-8R-CII-1-4]MDI6022551.1 extracellular solute-binding protein [Leucobacter sp. UT-8R-CII-1-4]